MKKYGRKETFKIMKKGKENRSNKGKKVTAAKITQNKGGSKEEVVERVQQKGGGEK